MEIACAYHSGMMSETADGFGKRGRIFFDAILHPHRSLSPRGFKWLMATAAFMMLSVGLVFTVLGAWPVIGFCGVEFILLYVMFRLNYRAARGYEHLRLSDSAMEIRKIDPAGTVSEWRFEPTWLQVNMDNPPTHESQLSVASHGRQLVVGAFLTPEERLEVAEALRDALHMRRVTPPGPAG